MLIPTPSRVLARALPGGLPVVRDQVQARTGLFTSALDPDGTPGDPGLFGPGSPTWEIVGQPSQAGQLPLPLIEEGELPTTVAGLRERMHAWRDELVVTELTRRLIDATIELTDLPAPQRAAIRPFVLARLATIPDEWHELLAPGQSRIEEQLAAQVVQTPLALLQVLFGPSQAVDAARARVRRGR